jgi:hypothetical protein
LAAAFAELMAEMYEGDERYVAPWDVKTWIARKVVQF